MKTEEKMHGMLDGPAALVEVEYLDLDGDGVPDAVQTIEAVAIDLTGDGVCDASSSSKRSPRTSASTAFPNKS